MAQKAKHYRTSGEHPKTVKQRRSQAELERQGLNPHMLMQTLDLRGWDTPPPGWVLAYAFRLCDPLEKRTLGEIERELGIPRTTGYDLRQKDEFKDLMLQIHESIAGTAFMQVYRVTLGQALDGSIEAQKVFYQLCGKLGGRFSDTRGRQNEDDRYISDGIDEVDDFRGESEETIEIFIAEQLDLIRKARIAKAVIQ